MAAFFACDAQGKLIGRLPLFQTSFGWLDVDLSKGQGQWLSPPLKDREDQPPVEIEVFSRGLVMGIVITSVVRALRRRFWV